MLSAQIAPFAFPPFASPMTDTRGITTPHWTQYFTDLSQSLLKVQAAIPVLPEIPTIPTVPDAPPPAPPITSLVFANLGLRVRDQGPTWNLTFQPLGVYSGYRTLGFDVGNVDRKITLVGSPVLGDWFDQCVKVTCSPTFTNLDLIGTLDTFQLFVNNFPVVVQGPSALNQNVMTTGSPTFANVTVPGATTTGTLIVNGFPVTVTSSVTLPQTVALPPNIAFNNIANPWSVGQTFPFLITTGSAGAWTTDGWGVAVQVTNAATLKWKKGTTHAWGIGQTNNNLYFIKSTADDASSAPTYPLQLQSDGNVTVAAFLSAVGVLASDTVQTNRLFGFTNARIGGATTPQRWLHVGNGAEAPTLAYSGVTVQGSNDVAQVSARYCTGGGGSVDGGFFAHPSGVFMGSFTVADLFIRTNNLNACQIRASDQTAIFMSHLRCSGLLEVGSGGYPFFYVGGWRVDVTANCSIPGTGGGASLPPNMVFSNVNNPWSAYQSFAGISFNGHDLDAWLNQSVKTDGSPTFANLDVSTHINAAHISTSENIAVGGELLATGAIKTSNAYWAGNQQGVSQTYIVQTSGPDRTLKFVGGICTQFA